MILQTIEQFQKAVPTAEGVSEYSDLETYVKSSELWLKINVLGDALYATIDANDSSTGELDELIRLCQSIIANFAYWDAVPFLDVVHTDSGFAVISATNKVPASKERIERLRAQCLLRRDAEIELLIAYLNAHVEFWDDWKGSDIYSTIYETLVPTLTIFKMFQYLEDQATFDKLKSAILTVQNTIVADVISVDYVTELVEKQKDNDMQTADNAILNTLRNAICKLALSIGINEMSMFIDATGVVRSKNTMAFNFASEERLKNYADTFKRTGTRLLDRVIDYMVINIEDFPTYASSKEYVARITPGYENEADATIFSSLY